MFQLFHPVQPLQEAFPYLPKVEVFVLENVVRELVTIELLLQRLLCGMVLSADIPKAAAVRGRGQHHIAFEFVEVFRIYIFVLEQVMKVGEHPEVFACGFSWLVRIELCRVSDLLSIVVFFVIRTSIAGILNVLMRLIK